MEKILCHNVMIFSVALWEMGIKWNENKMQEKVNIYLVLSFALCSLTCKTKRDAQARVAMIRRMEPMNQSLSEYVVVYVALLICPWWGACLVQTISTLGPLYKVINMVPATVTNVPTTLAWHLTFFMLIFSILST